MANLSVCAFIIPDGVETTSGVSSSVYQLTTKVTNYLAIVLVEGSLTRWTEDGQSSLVGSVENSVCNCISYSGLPALHDLSVDAPDPLTGHSYLLHTLHDFVSTSGLTFVQNVPLLMTHTSDCLSSSVCNLMRRRPIHLLPLA